MVILISTSLHAVFIILNSGNLPFQLRYRLDLVGAQVRWEGSGTVPTGEYTFFYGEGNENHELGTGLLYIRESYQQVRGLSLLMIGCHT
jgi:hypothetical protein